MLDFLRQSDAPAFRREEPAPELQERGAGNPAYAIDWASFVNNHYGALDGSETSLWARLAPAIANVVKVYARMLQAAPLTLVKPDGEVLRWPPEDGRKASSRAYQILRLWNERPNEIHSPSQIYGMMAEEWVYEGEIVMPQHRHANRVVRRMYVLPSNAVHINSFENQFNYQQNHGIQYSYYGVSKTLNTRLPQFMHLRNNVDPFWPLRGRPSFWNMPNEVAANAISSIYRKEVFRQGGPVRTALETDPESDISQTATEDQLQRIANRVAGNIKRMQSWMNSITAIPPGFKLSDWGPKSADEMYTAASRITDEKLSAVHGVPLMYQGNMESSTYNNARHQIGLLVKDAGSAFFGEIQEMIERVQLRPLGGMEALLKAKFDVDQLMRADLPIWNKLVLDRVGGGVWSVDEAREAFDSKPLGGKFAKPKDPNAAKPMQKAPAGDAKGVAKPGADKPEPAKDPKPK